MNAPKIGIIGTHGVGKTALVNVLGKTLDLPVVAETARDCPHPINEKGNILTQEWILANQIGREMSHFRTGMVSDRTTLDIVGYTMWLTKHGRVSLEDYQRLTRAACAWAITYDAILYVPIEFKLVGDGVRSVNEEYQTAVDKNLLDLLSSGVYRYTVITGNEVERAEKAIRYLDSIGVI